MTTEDGDVDPADQHSSNQRFRLGDPSGAGEPEITSTAGDNQHLYKDIKKPSGSRLPPSHSLTSSTPVLFQYTNVALIFNI